MTWKEFKITKQIIKKAIKDDNSISHIITYMPESGGLFVVTIFTEGMVTAMDKHTKELITVPSITATNKLLVPHKELMRVMNIIYKMIRLYEKIGGKK
jgi:hypothetical protein